MLTKDITKILFYPFYSTCCR